MQVIVFLLKVLLLGVGLVLIAAGMFCGAVGFSQPNSASVMYGLFGLASLAFGGVMVYALLRSFRRKPTAASNDSEQLPPEQP
ncbi:hypothetical protein J5J83_15940 [Azoarcus sp. L1K30]|uniref:hypothetical protein n=1 Tax=Azoarcus sp. L1K30 TaxID=2820277 RepID=UPI001B81DCCF|nr:hypothetical protein [Azoarcus sp. L1K30]MBR0567615.1 hypothetical protein [Azoarcus sp. L1K30]